MPILVVVFLISFLTTMNELILAQNLLRGTEGSYTLAVGLSAFVNAGLRQSRWGPFAAGSLIGAIPAVIVFFLSPALHRLGPHRRRGEGLSEVRGGRPEPHDAHPGVH